MSLSKAMVFAACVYCLLISNSPAQAAATPTKPKAEVNINEAPYISTYYVKALLTPTEPVTIRYFVTDWNHSKYRLDNDEFTFQVRLQYGLKNAGAEGRKTIKKEVKSGDHAIELGALAPGEYIVSLFAIDQFGRRTHVLFNEFLVREPEKTAITASETYTMTKADLETYGISNKGNHGSLTLIDKTYEDAKKPAEAIQKYTASVKAPPAGRYVIYATGKDGVPDFGNWKHCRVIYAEGYDHAKVEADAVKTTEGLNRLLEECRKKNFRKIILLPGTYRVSSTVSILIPDRFTVDLNGATIKLNEFVGSGAKVIQIVDCFDSHVINGIVEGDYFEHDYKKSEKNSEWVNGIGIKGSSKYCSFEDINIRNFPGYGATNGWGGNLVYPAGIDHKTSAVGDIDPATGEAIPCASRCRSDYVNIEKFCAQPYLAVSLYLGYQGLVTDSWNYTAHFYTKDKTYIGPISAYQYRIVKIPQNAAFMRVVVVSEKPEDFKRLKVTSMKIPWNCWFRNLKIVQCRCVGMAQAAMRNFLVEGCEFTRCGESGAFCAYDAEDGWDMMHDLTFRKNKFHGNHRNDFLTCAGHNFVVEENEGRIHIWDRTKSYVIRNNKFKDASFLCGQHNRTMYPRIDNNTFSGKVRLGSKNDRDDWTIVMRGPLKLSEFQCGKSGVLVGATLKDMKLREVNVRDCILENCDVVFAGSTFENSTLKTLRGHSNGKVLIRNCQMEDITSNVFRTEPIQILNSTLKDVQYHYAYWTKPGTILFDGCTIENSNKALIQAPAYSIKDFQILNSKIDTGIAATVEVYDLRAQDTDGEPGTILLSKNTIRNKKKLVIDIPKHVENKKPLTFINRKNKLKSDLKFVDKERMQAAWKVKK